MGLFGQDQFLRVKPQGLPENPEVFLHIFGIIPPVQANVQGSQVPGAHPAIAGGEAVGDGDPLGGQIFKCSNLV